MNTTVPVKKSDLLERLRKTPIPLIEKEIPIQNDRLKRTFDILFSLSLAPLLLPLVLITSLIIKLSSRGPIFHWCTRIGQGGQVIQCLKFRTMCEGADKKLERLLTENPDMNQEWITYRKLQNDPRIIPFGNLLRRTSIDEIPQFWNVLKGDLSVVGPRPPALFGPINGGGKQVATNGASEAKPDRSDSVPNDEGIAEGAKPRKRIDLAKPQQAVCHPFSAPVNKEHYLKEVQSVYGPFVKKVLSVKPGVTGMWQVSGRSRLSLEEKNKLEADYADHHTFFKDLIIIAKTIPAVLFSRGAF